MLEVAFLGERGSFSEQAALLHFGHGTTTKPYRTPRQVFRAVEERDAEYGVVPAENSLEGTVNQTYDLLLKSALRINGEIKTRVNHCLLSIPESRIEDLRIVHSHPQALAQCSIFLESLKVETEPALDTASAAKRIMERHLRQAGAIASERAAELYGLTILRRDIGNFSQNFTRFFIIGQQNSRRTGNDKTTIVFGTKHVPGSLHNALGELALRGINLTKIESRPLRTTPWEYHFFVDFDGHEVDDICIQALEGLRKSTTLLRVLGSYPRAPEAA